MSRKRKHVTPTGAVVTTRSRAERRRQEREERRRSRAPQLVVVVMIVVALGVSSLYPARQLVAKRSKVASLKKDSLALDRKIAELKAQRDALQTDTEVERLAREELGMIREGETAFAMVPQAPAQTVFAAPRVGAPAPAAKGLASRWWDAFSSTFRFLR